MAAIEHGLDSADTSSLRRLAFGLQTSLIRNILVRTPTIRPAQLASFRLAFLTVDSLGAIDYRGIGQVNQDSKQQTLHSPVHALSEPLRAPFRLFVESARKFLDTRRQKTKLCNRTIFLMQFKGLPVSRNYVSDTIGNFAKAHGLSAVSPRVSRKHVRCILYFPLRLTKYFPMFMFVCTIVLTTASSHSTDNSCRKFVSFCRPFRCSCHWSKSHSENGIKDVYINIVSIGEECTIEQR